MAKKINRGHFEDHRYIKYINSSEAILWKTKELSLPLDIVAESRERGTVVFYFIDKEKNKVWSFLSETVQNATKKVEGQEKQYYFPIGDAAITTYELFQEVILDE